ncbi:MAG: leucine-rich repeat protein [Acutalibacteraceae bacterium]
MPNSVTEIQNSAFNRCVSLQNVIIPDSVTEIGSSAFSNCINLKDVTLSKSLATLGYSAFRSTAIESIEIPKSLDNCSLYTPYNSSYTLDNIKYYDYTYGPFALCENLKTVTFEKGTTQIAQCLFTGCVGLEKITIPDTVTVIESYAFEDCFRLKEVTIPNSVTEIQNSAFNRCVSLPKVIIPDSITKIGDSVFEGCSALETTKLSKNIDKITSYMFRNCTSLKSIDVPEKVKAIQNYAFYGCSSLKEANLPEKLETIGSYAFQNCVALEKAILPKYVDSIGTNAFMGCEALATVDIADYSIQEIKTDTFKDCPGLTKIVLPKGLTKIGSQAFMNDTGLTEVVIPESVTSIDSTAFSYPAKTTIYGKSGSFAETFATEGGFKFSENSIPVEGIILKDGVENITLDVGETYRAEFEVYPEDANEVIVLTADNNNVSITGHDIYARYTGDTAITATATSGLFYEFNIHIRRANSITISKQPTKLSYLMGETLELSGMEIQVRYNDGSVKNVTDYTVSGFDSSVEGTSTVTVQWIAANGSKLTTTFDVEIVDPTPKVTGIFIETLPTKVQYELREKLDLTGMVVKANYNDGSVKEITDYTTSGFNALKNAAQVITVTYNGFTTTFTVFVGDVPTEHNYGDWVIDKEATCTESGSKHKTCSLCGDVVTETITATGHDYSTVWTIDVKATCTEAGSKSHHCTVCGDKADVTVIAAIGHTAVKDAAISATCTTAGKTEGSHCSVCDIVIVAQTTIAAKGHTSSDWITEKEATVNSAGSKHTKCTVCGIILKTEKIPQLKCAAPKLTKVESTSSGVKVTWGKTSGADSYIVYRKSYSDGKWSGWNAIKPDVSGSATSYTDTTAKSGVYYIYTVRGVNEAGKGSYDSSGLKIKFLSTPKLSSVANGSGKVTVKWSKVTGASSYTVYRKTYSNGKWSGWSKIGTTKNTYYNDTKVSSGKYYKYTVRATNGDYSSSYNSTGLKIKYLSVASLKSAVSQKAGVKVTWGKVTGAKGYEVYRKTYSNGKWSGWTKIKTVSSGSTVSYTDKSAKKGVTYKYTVRAISDSNKGYYNTSGLQVKDKY